MVLFVLVTITFFMVRLAPGGPFASERRLDPVIEKALHEKFHLDKPLPEQYGYFLADLLKGDLGPSFKHRNQSVNQIIAATLPQSIVLGGIAITVALSIGLAAGVVSALKHNTSWDYTAMTAAVVGISLPTFVIGPLLQLQFAVYWTWLPLAGYEGMGRPSYLVLPAVTLGLPFAARIARLMRAGMLDVLQQDFVRTARARGMPEYIVVFRHAFRGGILPVVSYLGPAFTQILTGSLVVEKIFQIPGLGREFVEAALNRDYTLVMGTVIVYGVFVVGFNLAADIAYGILDPRVQYEGA